MASQVKMLYRVVCLREDQKGPFAQALSTTGVFSFVGDNTVAPLNDQAALTYLSKNAETIAEQVEAELTRLLPRAM